MNKALGVIKSIFTIIVNLIKLFPRAFSKLFAAIPYLNTVMIFLPEIISFVKTLTGLVDKGVTKIEIKNRIKAVDKAFQETDRIKSAKKLRDSLTFK